MEEVQQLQKYNERHEQNHNKINLQKEKVEEEADHNIRNYLSNFYGDGRRKKEFYINAERLRKNKFQEQNHTIDVIGAQSGYKSTGSRHQYSSSHSKTQTPNHYTSLVTLNDDEKRKVLGKVVSGNFLSNETPGSHHNNPSNHQIPKNSNSKNKSSNKNFDKKTDIVKLQNLMAKLRENGF